MSTNEMEMGRTTVGESRTKLSHLLDLNKEEPHRESGPTHLQARHTLDEISLAGGSSECVH